MNERLKMANPQYDSHHTIPDRITITGIWKCRFGGDGKPEHSEKAFWSKGQNQKQTQPTWNQATVGILLHVPIQYHPYTPFTIILPVRGDHWQLYFYFSFWLV